MKRLLIILSLLLFASCATAQKANYTATAAPTVNDDISSRYAGGSLWLDVTNTNVYMCVTNADGAALWIDLSNRLLPADITVSGATASRVAQFDSSGYLQSGSVTLTELGKITGTTELTAIAGLTSAADTVPYFTGADTAALATFTSAGRALVDDASAAAQRTTLGLAIGSDVLAYDAAVQEIADLTPSNGDILYYNSAWLRLAKGSDDQVLTLASGIPSWAASASSIALSSFDTTQFGTNASGGIVFTNGGPITNLTLQGTVDATGTVNLTHTAAGDVNHALEIVLDSGNFADTRALEIQYDIGTLATNQDDAAILINIDQSDTTGGDIYGVEVLATEGSSVLAGLRVGSEVGVILQESGTFGDMDSALVIAADELADLINGAATTSVFVADNDTMTIGDAAKFTEIEFLLDTASSGSGIAPTFEFSTGVGTWASFTPVDSTDGMKFNGIIAWDSDELGTWAVGTGSEYLIRITRTRNSLSITPIAEKVQISSTTAYGWDKNGDITSGLINVDAGSVSAPSIAFTTNPDVGLFYESNGLTITADGTEVVDFFATGIFPDGDSTMANGSLGFTWLATHSDDFVASLGSAALPSYTFTGDTDSGMWSPGANQIAFSTTGVQQWDIDASGDLIPTADNSETIGSIAIQVANTFSEIFTASNRVVFAEVAAPSTPSAGDLIVYAKTDKKLYIKDSSGTETDLTSSGSSATFEATQFGSQAGGTNIIDGVTLTNIVLGSGTLTVPNGALSIVSTADSTHGIDIVNGSNDRIQFESGGFTFLDSYYRPSSSASYLIVGDTSQTGATLLTKNAGTNTYILNSFVNGTAIRWRNIHTNDGSGGFDYHIETYDGTGSYVDTPFIIPQTGAIEINRDITWLNTATMSPDDDATTTFSMNSSEFNFVAAGSDGMTYGAGGLTVFTDDITADSGSMSAGGTMTSTGFIDSGFTGNFALASDGAGTIVEVATTDTELGYVSGVTSAIQTQLGTKAALQVYKNTWIDAGAMVPRTTNGGAAATEEYATNDIMSDHVLFDHTTEEGAQFRMVMPDDWDLGAVKFKFFWDAATGASAADNVVWFIAAQAFSDDAAIDNAFTTEVGITNAVSAVGDLHVTAATAALTIPGTPALGDAIWFEVTRQAANASDTMDAEDAKLLGVQMQYRTLTTTPAAW